LLLIIENKLFSLGKNIQAFYAIILPNKFVR